MTAWHKFPVPVARSTAPLSLVTCRSWHDYLVVAREHHGELQAELAMSILQHEAEAKSGDPVNKAIADACQAWADCAGEPEDQRQALDEVAALLADDEPEPREARHESINDYGRWWL